MSGKASYWIGTILILIGAVLAWVGFVGPQWITYVGVVFLVIGAFYLFLTRRKRA